MTESLSEPATFEQADLRRARFRSVRLGGANFRMVDLSGAVMRDVRLSGASVYGSELDGLSIDGVEVAPLVEAELDRRYPARALRRAADPAGLQAAWAAVQQSWEPAYARIDALPAGAAEQSVDEEWSFAQTLRHLVFATDAWLGAVLEQERPFHPWGVPFSELEHYCGPAAELGVDLDATPTYPQVREVRADRVAKVRAYLGEVTPEQLAQECKAPPWDDGVPVARLRCLWVILNEELEHLRFAERDLAVIERRLSDAP